MDHTLSPYPKASLKELLHISVPIILSMMSGYVMCFIDRLFLAYYSLDAMNGAAVAGTTVYTFLLIPLSTCAVSEVFVGQFNGSKQYEKAGLATWQMLFIALGATFFFIPCTLYLVPLLIEPSLYETALPYANWYLGTGSLHCLSAALVGFFSGIGRTRIALYASIAGNLVNILLDPLFIFGYGSIPSMGVHGAVYATVLGELTSVIVLFYAFFKSPIREKYKTFTWSLDFALMKKSVRIGLPSALAHTIELLGWSLLLYFSAKKGDAFLTAFIMGQTVFLFFMFFTEGIEKGVTAIASNLIGSGDVSLTKKLLKSGFKMHIIWVLAVSPFFLIWPELWVDIFEIDRAKATYGSEIYTQSLWALRAVWVFMLIDGAVWILVGLLKAAGDTLFILFANPFCSFAFGFIPTVILMELNLLEPGEQWIFMSVYAIANLTLFIFRYRSNRWKKLNLGQSEKTALRN